MTRFSSTPSSSSSSSLEWSTDHVRSTFVEYFQKQHNHTMVPSSACAPLNDPTLLFTNAGMNQFKPIFLGQADPTSPLAKLQRAVNSQKCIRAGGKHNDLEDVGRDTYHHTFFEMLGTWSFGNYFKKEAIDMAWDLLTRVYALNPENLYATYFEGNEQIPADTEARDYWLQYLPAHKVIACSARDNFWEMGDVGPCGPCSEIHYDRIGNGRDASALVNQDDPNVIEIWNIVFIQFNREGPTELSTLPAKHIDTGMGLERLTSILQQKSSNYDIDCFQPLFEALQAKSPTARPYAGKLGADDADFCDTAYRAIADHARTLSFAIADGVIPNNEGRGYVLRRILRRAARYGQQILQLPSGFMAELVPIVVQTFGDAFPELKQQEKHIIQVIKDEEEAFGSMLQRGIQYFEQEIVAAAGSETTKSIPGKQAFYLYDTLGFPLDLTQLMAQEAGFTVDTEGFDQAMQEQKERSRQAQKQARNNNSQGDVLGELQAEQTAWLQQNDILPTDDSFKYEWDVELSATVKAIYTSDGFVAADDSAPEGATVGLILDKSSFYAVAGGQETDKGVLDIMDASNQVVGHFHVNDVQSYAGFVVHEGVLKWTKEDASSQQLKVGQSVTCRVDYERRQCIAPNHSMTHVLNAALRQVLGDSVDQRGSLCNDEKLRFDFSYNKALNVEQLQAIESFCQAVVAEDVAVSSQVLPLAEAQVLNGVRAVFGEVYPDPVRVITVGEDTSIEFCGGTHVKRTGEAKSFCLIEETAVAKGIRRITAVTQQAAVEALQQGKALEEQVLQLEKEHDGEVAGALRKQVDSTIMSAALKVSLRARLESIQKAANEAQKKLLQQKVDKALVQLEQQIGQVTEDEKALVLQLDIGGDSKASQRVLNTVQSLVPTKAFLGLSQEGSKVFAFCVVPDALVEQGFRADAWIQAALSPCGGRGGGKAGNAQGQAKECEDLSVVLAAAQQFAQSQVSSKVV
jgi:alanyl-tRNA synthetase